MNNNKKNAIGIIIKIVIIVIILLFIYACYNVDSLKNNRYIQSAKEKINYVVNNFSNNIGENDSSAIENYELDIVDTNQYEIEGAQNKYYYNQLDYNSKIIYKEISNNIEKIKNGEDYIKLSSKLSNLAKSDDMANALMQSFQNAWDAFRNDNMDFFYLDGTKMCLVTKTIKQGSKVKYEFYISKGKNNNYLMDEFENINQVNEAIAFVNNEEQNIIKSITEKNDYYKVLKVHNWIVDNMSYNLEEESNNANIYGALKNKRIVCEGYARLFKSLLDKMNIPCVFISGEGISANGKSENHAWNYVYLKGKWYAIDVTWDDPVILGNGKIDSNLRYKYFLNGSSSFNKTHKEDGKLVENGMVFLYPTLSSEDYVKEEK